MSHLTIAKAYIGGLRQKRHPGRRPSALREANQARAILAGASKAHDIEPMNCRPHKLVLPNLVFGRRYAYWTIYKNRVAYRSTGFLSDSGGVFDFITNNNQGNQWKHTSW